MYIAFVDILGFRKHVEENFNGILEMYSNVLYNIHEIDLPTNHSIRIISDSIIISSPDIIAVVLIVNGIYHYTLLNGFLVRGGIAHGRHVEVAESGNLYVVSKGLIKAVQLEEKVKYPCVAIHDDIDIPGVLWLPIEKENNLFRKLIYIDGMRIVNPFNPLWKLSECNRIEQMMGKYPEHRDKYLWILRLFNAVNNDYLLVPADVVKSYYDQYR